MRFSFLNYFIRYDTQEDGDSEPDIAEGRWRKIYKEMYIRTKDIHSCVNWWCGSIIQRELLNILDVRVLF